ncbi:hypothetical protein KY285_017566 [Solanum tuberosum]|nr:hypothetical protein KY285_017566 [Solanum tuberosum]
MNLFAVVSVLRSSFCVEGMTQEYLSHRLILDEDCWVMATKLLDLLFEPILSCRSLQGDRFHCTCVMLSVEWNSLKLNNTGSTTR